MGQIRRPVGLRGEVMVGPTGDDPDRFLPGECFFLGDPPSREIVILASRPASKGAIAIRFEGIDTVEKAEALRGQRLYVNAEDLPPLPPGVYYHYQLLGLTVVDLEGVILGRVESILETGSNDVYCVGKGEAEILIPAVPDFVAEVDLLAGKILLSVDRSKLGEDDRPD